MGAETTPVRIGLVLSAGGVRGAAHLGVLRQIVRHQIPIDVMVGVSAGAIIASYYVAVGLTLEHMIDDAPAFRGRHLLMHGVTLRAPGLLKPYLRRFCGVIPKRLAQLEAASFDRLHHGIQRLGIVCHDLISHRPVYFSTGRHHGARLSDIARASAAVQGVMPSRLLSVAGQLLRLTDGGVSDSLPVDFARSPGLDATHLIVSDCRRISAEPTRANLVYIKPQLDGVGSLMAPHTTLVTAVRQGEAAVSSSVVREIQRWLQDDERTVWREEGTLESRVTRVGRHR
jgi:predicted acylesterase/phospholipase RssA